MTPAVSDPFIFTVILLQLLHTPVNAPIIQYVQYACIYVCSWIR